MIVRFKHLLSKFLKTIYRILAPFGSKRYQLSYKTIQGLLINYRPLNVHYRKLLRRADTIDEQRSDETRKSIEALSSPPLFSVIMPVYNPSLKFLTEAIESVQAQYYPHWELCISDDASTVPGVRELIRHFADNDTRIRYVFREQNGHISASSNSALNLAEGDYIVLLDHDDRLHPLALFEAAQVITAHPDCEIIYSDEDKITERGKHFNPYFKPDFNYELLLSHNMVSHLGIYKFVTVRKVGGFRLGLEGSQDYDLLLRVLEQVTPEQIHHIPRVLYHWRSSSQSVAENINIKPYAVLAGQKALNEHLERMGKKGEIIFNSITSAYQVKYEIPEPRPAVQIILATSVELIAPNVIENLSTQVEHESVSVTVVLLGDDTLPTDEIFNADPRISFINLSSQDGIAKCINNLVKSSKADFVALLNGDIIEYSRGWLEELLAQAIQKGIGAVGPKILSNNGYVYSNGMILDSENIAKHFLHGQPRDYAGYFGWGQVRRGFSALSGKCLLVRRMNYLAVNGLSEGLRLDKHIWVDFCLKLKELGLRNVLCPSICVRMAKSKVNDVLPEKEIMIEREYMLEKWGEWLTSDPAFNPNIKLVNGNIKINASSKTINK